jgi:hypothetical protein
MSKTDKTTATPTSEEAILKALASQPDTTTAEIASAAGLGRSTASKALAQLASSGEVSRTAGGREGARRLPDRFSLASAVGERQVGLLITKREGQHVACHELHGGRPGDRITARLAKI